MIAQTDRVCILGFQPNISQVPAPSKGYDWQTFKGALPGMPQAVFQQLWHLVDGLTGFAGDCAVAPHDVVHNAQQAAPAGRRDPLGFRVKTR